MSLLAVSPETHHLLESLFTTIAIVRPLIRVNSHVSNKISTLNEGFCASGTNMGFLSCVDFDVVFKSAFIVDHLSTDIAGHSLFPCVCFYVTF